MLTSEQTNEITEALIAVASELTNPERNRKVEVKTDKGKYSFQYTTLDALLDHARPVLAKNGVAMLTTLEPSEGGLVLETRLQHKSGQFVASKVPVRPERNGAQALGAVITYMRRYALSSMLPISSTEDTDSNVDEGNKLTDRKGVMEGDELQNEYWSEFWEKPNYMITLSEAGDPRQWLKHIGEGFKRAPAEPLLRKLWEDNDTTLSKRLNPRQFRWVEQQFQNRLDTLEGSKDQPEMFEDSSEES